MKILNKKALVVVLAVVSMFGLAGLIIAATTVNLGTADNFAVLAGSAITNTGSSVINGDLGLTPGSAVTGFPPGTISGTQYVADAIAVQAQNDLITAYLDAEGRTPPITIYPPIHDLGGKTLTPGVYNDPSSFGITGTLTLDAQSNPDAVFIFQAGSTLITEVNSVVSLINGAQACNVFWQVGSSATLKTNSEFYGNILALTDITLQNGANVDGRVLARNGAVTLDTNTITKATCAVSSTPTPTPTSGSSAVGGVAQNSTINVVKIVINDNGQTKTVADFPLFVNGISVISGVTNTFSSPAPAYIVTETADPNYTQTFSGDCDIDGRVPHNPGDNKFCIITNNDIGAPVVIPPVPPLIDVVKTASPLSLPAGPGPVTYTYTLRNMGTIPVTDITMVGDTCSPIILVSGDTNSDSKLDVNETWVHICTTTLLATHTNTVVATGWANGISAVDIASATVVVSVPTPGLILGATTHLPNTGFPPKEGGTSWGIIILAGIFAVSIFSYSIRRKTNNLV